MRVAVVFVSLFTTTLALSEPADAQAVGDKFGDGSFFVARHAPVCDGPGSLPQSLELMKDFQTFWLQENPTDGMVRLPLDCDGLDRRLDDIGTLRMHYFSISNISSLFSYDLPSAVSVPSDGLRLSSRTALVQDTKTTRVGIEWDAHGDLRGLLAVPLFLLGLVSIGGLLLRCWMMLQNPRTTRYARFAVNAGIAVILTWGFLWARAPVGTLYFDNALAIPVRIEIGEQRRIAVPATAWGPVQFEAAGDYRILVRSERDATVVDDTTIRVRPEDLTSGAKLIFNIGAANNYRAITARYGPN